MIRTKTLPLNHEIFTPTWKHLEQFKGNEIFTTSLRRFYQTFFSSEKTVVYYCLTHKAFESPQAVAVLAASKHKGLETIRVVFGDICWTQYMTLAPKTRKDYSGLTIQSLRRMARNANIKGSFTMSKHRLIDLLGE